MAQSFWKALGSKLVETGAAHLQQVNVVSDLKQLSPQEARHAEEELKALTGSRTAGMFTMSRMLRSVGALVVAGLLIQQGSRGAVAQEPAAWLYGPTNVTCGGWLKSSSNQKQVYEWWVLGFVSGAGTVLAAAK